MLENYSQIALLIYDIRIRDHVLI